MTSPPALPERYLEWLDSRGKRLTVEFGDREWKLASRAQLAKTITIDGQKAPFVEQTRLCVNSIVEATGASQTQDFEGQEIPFSRVAKFLAIGTENEDVLCIEPTGKHAVWCFMPSEGGLLEKLAGSLEQFLRANTAD